MGTLPLPTHRVPVSAPAFQLGFIRLAYAIACPQHALLVLTPPSSRKPSLTTHQTLPALRASSMPPGPMTPLLAPRTLTQTLGMEPLSALWPHLLSRL